MADTFDILQKVVSEAVCKPGWKFRLTDEDGAKRLVIQLRTCNNYDMIDEYVVNHYHPVPVCTFNEASWRRWVYDKCIATMVHELGEALRFGPDEERPFAPLHGPGENPYTVHEYRPVTDALVTQDGTLRKGPV